MEYRGEEEDETRVSLSRHKPTQPGNTYPVFTTVVLLFSFACLGLSESPIGPSLVSMEILLDTDTKRISTVFTGGAVGHLIGAIVCGYIYTKLNTQLIFAASILAISIMLPCMAFSPNVIVFVAAHGIQSFFMATMDTAGQAYLLKIWKGSRHRQPLTQGLHLMWSVGCTIGPFVVRAFLVDLPDNVQNITQNNQTDTGMIDVYQILPENTNNIEGKTVSPETVTIKDVEYVRFSYIVLSSIILSSCVLFVILFFLRGPSCFIRTRTTQDDRENRSPDMEKQYKTFRLRLLVILFVFYILIVWIEGCYGSLISVFVIKGLGWSNLSGALAASVFWGTHGIGRILAIPLSSVMAPKYMLSMNMTVSTVGCVLFFLVHLHPVVTWVAVGSVGVGMSSTFATGVLLAEEYIDIDGSAASIIFSAASVGVMIGPALTGFLMDHIAYMCYVYTLFTATLMSALVFLFTLLYVKRAGAKHRQLETEVTLSDGVLREVEMMELNGPKQNSIDCQNT